MQSKHFFRISQDKSGINLLCLSKIALIRIYGGQCLGAEAKLRILPLPAFRLIAAFGLKAGEDVVLVFSHGGVLLRGEKVPARGAHSAVVGGRPCG